MIERPSIANRWNLSLIEDTYQRWLADVLIAALLAP